MDFDKREHQVPPLSGFAKENQAYEVEGFEKRHKYGPGDAYALSVVSNSANKVVLNVVGDVIGEEGNANPVEDASKTTPNTTNHRVGLRKDLRTIAFLMFMYFLQGIPLGLASAVPLILGARKVGLSVQGTFSFAFWPFSIKLLWAPIVDSFYFSRIGRRRSWIIPVNLAIAVFMFAFARLAKNLLKTGQSQAEIIPLAIIFMLLTVLAATQDIIVDGWAISLLSKEHVTWQSICNGVGQRAGIYVSNVCFIIFESTSFCNEHIRPLFNWPSQDYGMVDLEMFMYFFGVIFLATAVLIYFFKNEKSPNHPEQDEECEKLSFYKSYHIIWRLFSLRAVRELTLILLTINIGTATEKAAQIKLVEYGVSKETISLLAVPLGLITMIWPFVLSKFVAKHNPFMIYYNGQALKTFFVVITLAFVYFTPRFMTSTGSYTFTYFAIYVCFMILSSVLDSTVFISSVAFSAKVADPQIGGTYMTLVGTIMNLGSTSAGYPGTLGLYLIGFFTTKACLQNSDLGKNSTFFLSGNFTSQAASKFNQTVLETIKANTCASTDQEKDCKSFGAICVTQRDAYFMLTAGAFLIGVVWLIGFYKFVKRMSYRPKSDWKLDLSK